MEWIKNIMLCQRYFTLLLALIAKKSLSLALQIPIMHKNPHDYSAFYRTNQSPYKRRKTIVAETILSWDDGESLDDVDDCADDYTPVDDYFDCGTSVAERISVEKMASLARLAVAFSPPDRCISLKDIEHVEVLCVDENHIELSAVLCEDDGCVATFVPVSFVKECESEQMEECVFENIVDLDLKAQCILREKERMVDDEEEQLEIEQVYNRDVVNFPSWWIPPDAFPGMVKECNSVQRLLNTDDFQAEVTGLAIQGLNILCEGRIEVKRTAVAAIGPSGFYLRAAIKEQENISGEDILKIVDIPFPFRGGVVETSKTFRAAVLNAIASNLSPCDDGEDDVEDNGDDGGDDGCDDG